MPFRLLEQYQKSQLIQGLLTTKEVEVSKTCPFCTKIEGCDLRTDVRHKDKKGFSCVHHRGGMHLD